MGVVLSQRSLTVSRTSARVEQAISVAPTKTNDSFGVSGKEWCCQYRNTDCRDGSYRGLRFRFTPWGGLSSSSHGKCQRQCLSPECQATEPILYVPTMQPFLKAGTILLVFFGQLTICLWFSGATDLELFGRPVFFGSENWEIRAGRHHQEGSPAPCGQVNARSRRGRDSG